MYEFWHIAAPPGGLYVVKQNRPAFYPVCSVVRAETDTLIDADTVHVSAGRTEWADYHIVEFIVDRHKLYLPLVLKGYG